MAAYLSAQALLAESSEYKLQGLLAEDIGMLNYGQRMYDASILNFKRQLIAINWQRILWGLYMLTVIWRGDI